MEIRTHNGHWAVFAHWYGAERIVHQGTIWECIEYRRETELAQWAGKETGCMTQ